MNAKTMLARTLLALAATALAAAPTLAQDGRGTLEGAARQFGQDTTPAMRALGARMGTAPGEETIFSLLLQSLAGLSECAVKQTTRHDPLRTAFSLIGLNFVSSWVWNTTDKSDEYTEPECADHVTRHARKTVSDLTTVVQNDPDLYGPPQKYELSFSAVNRFDCPKSKWGFNDVYSSVCVKNYAKSVVLAMPAPLQARLSRQEQGVDFGRTRSAAQETQGQ